MPISKIIIVVLFITLIGFILYNNKVEIEARTALAELKVEEWPVEIKKVDYSTHIETFKYHGVLTPEKSLRVIPLAQGQVDQLMIEEGDRVKRGDILARLNADLLLAELSAVEAALAQSQANLSRMESLSAGEAITAQQLEQAQLRLKADQAKHQSLEKRISHTVVRAPFSGTIKDIHVETGGVIGPGIPLCELIDQSILQLSLSLTEEQVVQVTKGMKVTVEPDLYPGRALEAIVSNVAIAADRSLKFPVEVDLPNSRDYPLKSGMFATARFSTKNNNGLWIDRRSILGGLDNPYLFVVSENTAILRKVILGKSASGLVEIVDGLKVDDQLVTAGQRNLKDGVKVRIIREHP